MGCNICGSDGYSIRYKSYTGDLVAGIGSFKETNPPFTVPVRIVECLKCGLVYTYPKPQDGKFPDDDEQLWGGAYASQERGGRLDARGILSMLKRAGKSEGRVVVVGFGTGFLVDEAKKARWDVQGIELSEPHVEYAKNVLGLNLGRYEQGKDLSFVHQPVDVVILKDCLEHLEDPKSMLVRIRQILNPSGYLYLSTPNINSFASRVLKARWWGVRYSHLYYFTPKTLRSLLDVTGFVLKQCRGHRRAFTMDYWIKKIAVYDRRLSRCVSFFAKGRFSRLLVRVNLGDRIQVLARKSRRLEYLHELESVAPVVSKMKSKVVVVLPAYNAAQTLHKTVEDIPREWVDEIVLVDDCSKDQTVNVARQLGLTVHVHEKNLGYGGNQKTCYNQALKVGADIVVMVHPDYQYDPKAIPAMIEPIQNGQADAVFGSRMMKRGALEGGMPLWKHNANILLTALENVVLGTYLTEYHSGFRAYSRRYLEQVRYDLNSNGFVFDTEIIVQGIIKHMKFEEVPIRTRYFDEASTIKFWPSVRYGLGILKTMTKYLLHQKGVVRFRQFL